MPIRIYTHTNHNTIVNAHILYNSHKSKSKRGSVNHDKMVLLEFMTSVLEDIKLEYQLFKENKNRTNDVSSITDPRSTQQNSICSFVKSTTRMKSYDRLQGIHIPHKVAFRESVTFADDDSGDTVTIQQGKRCGYCGSESRPNILCVNCKVFLHCEGLVGDTCWQKFHTEI